MFLQLLLSPSTVSPIELIDTSGFLLGDQASSHSPHMYLKEPDLIVPKSSETGRCGGTKPFLLL